jgi:hypothetical protein
MTNVRSDGLSSRAQSMERTINLPQGKIVALQMAAGDRCDVSPSAS